jgi:DNA-binding NtrC family response regulator
MVRILIADPDRATQQALRELLDGTAEALHVTDDGLRALRVVIEQDVDLVIAELKLAGMNGLDLLREVQKLRPDAAVILQTAFGTVEDAVRAMRDGAADFLSKPYSSEQIRIAIDRSVERLALIKENQDLRTALDDRLRLDNLVANDPGMRDILKTVQAVAPTRTTVLITGESGTGKTLLARAIHRLSGRARGPFIEVNCGALPESLLESELFGHVRGAFTGAVRDRAGKFEAAHGGTIFLDEIGTSSPSFQVKLLRVLQDRVIERLGDTRTIPVDVRVLLATNQDLHRAVQEGRFREDLYYRINVLSIPMPPLRERRSDIPSLADYFLRRFAAEIGKPIAGFAPDAMELLMHATFPGNVRQLENLVERAVVLAQGPHLTAADLPPDLQHAPRDPATGAPIEALLGADLHLLPLKQAMELPEKILIERALEAHHGNRQLTAASLGINRSTLFNKMRKFGLL